MKRTFENVCLQVARPLVAVHLQNGPDVKLGHGVRGSARNVHGLLAGLEPQHFVIAALRDLAHVHILDEIERHGTYDDSPRGGLVECLGGLEQGVAEHDELAPRALI